MSAVTRMKIATPDLVTNSYFPGREELGLIPTRGTY
jgi:hypothetical protein